MIITMSTTRSRPYEKAMALGGVATGSMNAYDAAMPAGSSTYSTLIWSVACTHIHDPASFPRLPSRYQKGKTNLDFTEARDSEWQWRQLGHMQVCISLQTDSHASTPPLSFLQAGCPSCRPTNSVKALKATSTNYTMSQ